MAKDLIPPPSPAGRPAPQGEESLLVEQAAPQIAEQPVAAVPRLAPDSPHKTRIGFILGALIGLGIAAAALTALVLSGGAEKPATVAWSAWHPESTDGLDAAAEISLHVAREYRLGSGDQLVAVQAGPLTYNDVPLTVAIRSAPLGTGGNIDLVNGTGVLYTLNGLGPNGSIKGGKPSESRHLLLRREALELALYSFKYIANVDEVVVLLPPAPPGSAPDAAATPSADSSATPSPTPTPTATATATATTTAAAGAADASASTRQAVYFRPGDLAAQLQLPLAFTLSPVAPRPETIGGAEGKAVDTLTTRNLFTASFDPNQVSQGLLVLERLRLP